MNFVRRIRGLRLGRDGSLDKLAVPLPPDVGKALGLSKNHTYEAARAGEIPTIKIGRCLRVPLVALQQDAGGRREAEAGQQVTAHEAKVQKATKRYEDWRADANPIYWIAVRGGNRMGAGHIRPRGPGSYELKHDAGRDPNTGRRITKYVTVRGAKRDAQRELRKLLEAVDKGVLPMLAK